MYSGISKFFNDNSIYLLQFGFRQKYSTTHAISSLTEDITKNLDEGNIGCGIFVDLQKAFDTVKHDILLAKEHYGICGLANEWFRSYLSSRKQYVLVNGHKSCFCFTLIVCCTARFSPWSTFFVFNIHQWPELTYYLELTHDNNLLHFNKSVANLNKFISQDMKNLTVWLNAN